MVHLQLECTLSTSGRHPQHTPHFANNIFLPKAYRGWHLKVQRV